MVKLRGYLKSHSNEYYFKFLHIEKIVKNIMPNVRVFFLNYANHDILHLENVEQLVDKIQNILLKVYLLKKYVIYYLLFGFMIVVIHVNN